ncbi:MAG: four helix bundle protein [Opitutaceae bacterium]|nr:four helix bundle protein [Opitutaceae bacterium]
MEHELKTRTKAFALRTIKMVESLPKSMPADIMARQVVRAATSVAANDRAACRGRSKAEFVAKLGVVEEESDECCFWLEMIVDAGLLPISRLAELRKEADEQTAIFMSSLKTARDGRNPQSAIRTPHSQDV